MSTYLVTPGPGRPVDRAQWQDHAHALRELAITATFHSQLVPVTLLDDTRRSISTPLNLAISFAGRAQATLARTERRAQRADFARLQVALRHTGQDLVLLGAHHLHPVDVALFRTTTTNAGVDLWLVPDEPLTRDRHSAFEHVAPTTCGLEQTASLWRQREGHDRRRQTSACEAALTVGTGTAPAPACTIHQDAGECVLASFGDALITARLDPVSLRTRLHELTRTLPETGMWNVLAAARDPYAFLDRALERLDLTTQDAQRLRIGSLTPDGDQIHLATTTVDIPPHVRGVLRAHRDIRVAEGSTPDRPFCIPTDDRTRPRSPLR